MKVTEILTESLSRVAFHYTPLFAGLQILNNGEFKLSASTGSIEQKYAPKGYHYFLSATRTLTGGYHNTIHSSGGVMFVLNGDWFNARYPARAVDYWENRDPTKAYGRSNEAEDRIFSKENSIPVDGVSAIHIIIKNPVPTLDDQFLANARQLMISAKQRGIPAYFYTDEAAWRRLDTSKTADISLLKGRKEPRRNIPSKNYLGPLQELIGKKSYNDLGKDAKSLARSLGYTYDKDMVVKGIKNDFSNYRKPESGLYPELVKVVKFMRSQGLNTVESLVDLLADKWAPKK